MAIQGDRMAATIVRQKFSPIENGSRMKMASTNLGQKLERHVEWRFLNFRREALLGGWLVFFLSWAMFVSTLVAQDELAPQASLQQLREVQKSVSSVVSENMDTCVAVTDGVGFGSGVIVNAEGLVLTAGHVMTGEGPYDIILPTGRTVKARALGKNMDVDTGMVQITEPGPWPYVEISEATHDRRGEWVVSLGHSGGFELGRLPPVRTGRVLSRKRHQLLTDAVLIGGDSGGPLFDLEGRLIAIHSSIGDSVAENRHVTVDVFRRDWDRLLAGESWGSLPELNEPGESKRRGKIGVTVDREAPNARIKTVKPGSPAAEAGMRSDDIVTEFDGTKIQDGTHLIELIKTKHAGEVFSMAILRNGRSISFEIQLK
jgi:serine protease Do